MVKKEKRLEFVFKGQQPYFWIILIGFLLYAKTLFFNFAFLDDNVLILDNQYFLRNLSNILQTFKQDVFLSPSKAYYRPILTISFMLDAQLGGASPFIYHFTNIVIHLLASCLLFLFLRKFKVKKELALFFSLIFTVHPILTQAVAWIPGRNDSLFTVFVFSSLIFFLKFLKNKKWRDYLWHLLFFALAIFTKETTIGLIIIGFLYLLLFEPVENLYISRHDFSTLPVSTGIARRIMCNSFNKKVLGVGWLVVLVVWFLLRQKAFSVGSPIKMTIFDMGRAMLSSSPAVIQYVGKVIFPLNLSVLPIIQDTTFIYGFIAIILLIVALIFSKNKRYNFVIFGLFWFLLFLIPSLIRPNTKIVADFIEHRVYLPMIGLIILILEIDWIKNLDFKKEKTLIISGTFIGFLAILTFIYSDNFKDRLSFWKNAASTSPHSPLAHRNLGAMYYLDGQLDKAEPEYKKALELNQYEAMAHMNLGLIYMSKNRLSEAEEEFEKEIEINSSYDNVYFNFGLLRYRQEKPEEAIKLWQKTIEINPNFIDAYKNLAIYYYGQKDLEKANVYIEELQKRGISLFN